MDAVNNKLAPALAYDDQERQFARAFAIIREGIGLRAFPGAALAVTHRGALVASQGFGRFTYASDSPQVRRDTVFDLASITKVVATTALAMLLYEQGRLSLDEPVSHALPEFITLAPRHQHAARQRVTLRMLLAHSSGLPAYEKLFEYSSTPEELLRSAITAHVTEPGSRSEYSDIGFILLGEILQRRLGRSLDVAAGEQVFTPLGMKDTCFNPPPQLRHEIPPTEDDTRFRHRVIQGEVNDENAHVLGGVAGHAGVFAAAADVACFAECMLRDGAPVWKAETVALFTRRQTAPVGTSRALGWDTPSRPESSSGHLFSDSSFGHLGFTGTSLWVDPEKHLSVTFLTNRTWPDRSSQLIRQVRPILHDAVVEAL